jgi:DNA mismatch repair protein MutS2
MAVFIQSASDDSLVLMDELGSGTDPNFGGAIAQAVLQSLVKKKVWGVITTHYYNLKLFAGQNEGIRNAAMRFDDKNLVPLFVLDIGKPGSSFALEIARKTGLPEDTLAEAEKLAGKDLTGFETLVRNLEKERLELQERLTSLGKQEAQLKESLSRYQSLSTELETRKKEIIEKAKTEASQLLKETNREIEKTIRHIRENKAEKKETLKVRQSLKELSNKVSANNDKRKAKKDEILEGDRVRILGQEGSGIVLAVKGKKANVQLGEIKSLVDIHKLEKVEGGMPRDVVAKLRSSGINIYKKQATFNSTLDIRGKRVEEVIPLLDQFLDTAILLGQGELRILHGKGEGVLRKVVRDNLKRIKAVASFADEHVERGGDGVTVVVLK